MSHKDFQFAYLILCFPNHKKPLMSKQYRYVCTSRQYRYVRVVKVCQNSKGMSKQCRYVKIVLVCQSSKNMSNKYRYVKVVQVFQNSAYMSKKYRYVKKVSDLDPKPKMHWQILTMFFGAKIQIFLLTFCILQCSKQG